MKRKRSSLFYLLMTLAAGMTVLLLVLLAPGALPDTPPVLLATPPATASSAVLSPESPVEGTVISIAPDTVRTALRTLSRADSYSRSLTVRNFWDGGSSTSTVDVWVRGSMSRLAVRSGSRDRVKNILLTEDAKWIWYSDSLSTYSGAVAADEADRWQTIYSYERIVDLPLENIYAADFVEFRGENCIYVRFSDSPLHYESRCYISCASGLLMGEDIYDGETLVYSMRSTSPDISTPDMEVFLPP